MMNFTKNKTKDGGGTFSPIPYADESATTTPQGSRYPGDAGGSKSPFFAPSTPRRPKIRRITTPGGSTRTMKTMETIDEKEHKSTVAGASSNLINAIVGAGIAGIPYAVRQCGMGAGFAMILFCAMLTEKSLRLLVSTAKHVNVPSYELLCESAFGHGGFIFISVNMFIMAYGGMLSYLIIVKDTLPRLVGVSLGNVPMERAVLTLTSMVTMLPLSMQRDMADLAKTSRISVVFDCLVVLLVAIFSPVHESVSTSGGFGAVLSSSVVHPSTFFVGLSVLSFAFVCQHSSFIIVGSLERPTTQRWSNVTFYALITCCILATTCGLSGFLGFMDNTEGNILNNFEGLSDPSTIRAANVARALLCTTMFFVYPMESFVARHVLIVLLFRGRRAHEGDDHAVLKRADRRVALTLILYIVALVPALLFEDLGPVLAVTGAIAGSCLSYIGPGACYLAVHGESFLQLVKERWEVSQFTEESDGGEGRTVAPHHKGIIMTVIDNILWYVLLIPFWCQVASFGKKKLIEHEEKEALKSPHPNRIGNVELHNQLSDQQKTAVAAAVTPPYYKQCSSDEMSNYQITPLVRADSMTSADLKSIRQQRMIAPSSYGAVEGTTANQSIAAAIVKHQQKRASSGEKEGIEILEEDPQHDPPTWYDFYVAMGYVGFGVVALCAGLYSIFSQEK